MHAFIHSFTLQIPALVVSILVKGNTPFATLYFVEKQQYRVIRDNKILNGKGHNVYTS